MTASAYGKLPVPRLTPELLSLVKTARSIVWVLIFKKAC